LLEQRIHLYNSIKVLNPLADQLSELGQYLHVEKSVIPAQTLGIFNLFPYKNDNSGIIVGEYICRKGSYYSAGVIIKNTG